MHDGIGHLLFAGTQFQDGHELCRSVHRYPQPHISALTFDLHHQLVELDVPKSEASQMLIVQAPAVIA
jgi:CO/xanthine dehydrogenase Mo-binding subunit